MGVIEAIVNNLGALAILLVGVGCIIAFLEFLYKKDEPRKSFKYRKLLVDLFVAGKMKQLAKEDGINLVDEEAYFNKWDKKKRLSDVDLDDTIEEEMKEEISEEISKKLNKEEKVNKEVKKEEKKK